MVLYHENRFKPAGGENVDCALFIVPKLFSDSDFLLHDYDQPKWASCYDFQWRYIHYSACGYNFPNIPHFLGHTEVEQSLVVATSQYKGEAWPPMYASAKD